MEMLLNIIEAYFTVTATVGIYHAVKLVEMKNEHDAARGKDSKNLRLQLARHHMSQLKASLLWPVSFKKLILAAKWVKEVRE